MKDFSLPDRTVLLTVAGSRAYGMHMEDSDLDVKGIFVPPLKYYFGTKRIEQIDDKAELERFSSNLSTAQLSVKAKYGMEGTLFEVRRFLDLAAGANPNILDVLFCREQEVILNTTHGLQIGRAHV